MSKILDTAQIRTKIGGIKQSASNLRKNVHETAVAVVGHALRHGTSPLATLLVQASSGANQRALVAWLEKAGPFAYDKGAQEFHFSKARAKALRTEQNIADQDDVAGIETYMDELYAGAQWWEAKPAKPVEDNDAPLNVETEARDWLRKLGKRVKTTERDLENLELLTYLEAALAKYVSDMALIEAQRTARQAEPQVMQADVDVDTTVEA